MLYGLQQGNQVLKEIHKEMSLEAVEKLMEETDEARAYQREVSNLLAGAMTNEEEDAVEDELEALEREVSIVIVAIALPRGRQAFFRPFPPSNLRYIGSRRESDTCYA